MMLMKKVITDAQAILAEYLVPDSGISDHECINRLLGLLDGSQAREALRALDAAAPSSALDSQPPSDARAARDAEESTDSIGDWQCRDYGDGWITFPDRKAAEKYQEETGAMMRYRRFYPALKEAKGG